MKILRTLDTCPPEWLKYYLGDCQHCDRPIAPHRRHVECPEMGAWFMQANNSTTCRSCYSRIWEAANAKQGRATRSPRVPVSRVLALRAMVGACLECGWAQDDDAGPHVARGCKKAPAPDHDLKESA